jgi:hypothetical protein
MMPTFDLVPRAATDAIVSFADGIHYFQALAHPAFVNQMRSDMVLDARPDFIGIDEREARATSMGPGAE